MCSLQPRPPPSCYSCYLAHFKARALLRAAGVDDAALRAFLAAVDTEAIHGAPAVPGHGRWSPRTYRGTYAP